MKTYEAPGDNGVSSQRRLALISAAGAICGAMGFLLDRSQPLRGLLVGAVTGASLAGVVSARLNRGDDGFNYYSKGKRLYEKYETEAGV
jgi:hypothetical protein